MNYKVKARDIIARWPKPRSTCGPLPYPSIESSVFIDFNTRFALMFDIVQTERYHAKQANKKDFRYNNWRNL